MTRTARRDPYRSNRRRARGGRSGWVVVETKSYADPVTRARRNPQIKDRVSAKKSWVGYGEGCEKMMKGFTRAIMCVVRPLPPLAKESGPLTLDCCDWKADVQIDGKPLLDLPRKHRLALAAQSAKIARMKHAGDRAVSWIGRGFQHQRRSSNANNIVDKARLARAHLTSLRLTFFTCQHQSSSQHALQHLSLRQLTSYEQTAICEHLTYIHLWKSGINPTEHSESHHRGVDC